MSIAFIACNKNKKSASISPTIYCVYTYNGTIKTFKACCDTKEAMQSKTVELRNSGFTDVRSESKSNCSECN